MKKVFGQTVRDLKRGVNKKVLKVPGIEQKILDATSSEPWGPHGSDMAELAQASRNYHEYQLIMAVIWKRINDTGKKWRHVYKALTVLEYLVAHGSERVIDEIREHAYQISTLADFQYIDSNGRDQGSNIRRKSQGLVALVNSKEKIQEIRQKAQSNKERYNGAPSSGGAYRNSSHSGAGSYSDRDDNGHNGNGDSERSGYGREREMGYRDYDERYGRENYADGRGRSSVDYQTRSRKSIDGYTERSFDDDDRYSSRSGGGKGDDQSQDERERRTSEHSIGTPPSYEEATRDVQNTTRDERDRDVIAPSQVPSSPVPKPNSPSKSTDEVPHNHVASGVVAAPNDEFVDAFDDFDPRGPLSAAPPATSSPELDIFGLSTPDSANSLAVVPAASTTTTFEANLPTDSGFGTHFGTLPSSDASTNQTSEDPFGDSPFKAIPEDNFPSQPQNFQPGTSFQPSGSNYGSDTLPSASPKVDSFPSFDFGNALDGFSYAPIDVNGQHSSGSSFSAPELPAEQSSNDILDSIFPRTGFSSHEVQPAPTNMQTAQMNFLSHPGLSAPVASQGYPSNSQTFQTNPFHSSEFSASVDQGLSTSAEPGQMNRFPTSGQSAPVGSQESPTNSQNLFLPSTASHGSPRNIQVTQGNFLQPSGLSVPAASQGSVTNMPTSQMSLLQPGGSSAPQGTQQICSHLR
ncbi:clathrin interactor EPSIN 3-like [Iris pallida]|uniref:Clathrin interactor EPSIN 3-like n=1 Tax=Iris pallida TaxID=29817 RepID=A0AAX6FSS3_IRIPA|nr:clathrin interactor EPSIN 3-like [Iris pallida]